MTAPLSSLAAGFDDSAHEAQQIFRAVLDAFAHPGRIVALPSTIEAPAPLSLATAAFLLTLVDRETPLFLAPAFSTDETIRYVRFHTGAPVVLRKADAVFAVISADGAALPDECLGGFAIGSDAWPDRSATVVIELPSLHGGPRRTLRGPGIEDTAEIEVAGLDDSFWAEWAANRELFPCGVDVVFAAGTELLALPRGIAVEI
jgi:alpha-D-ribose 1-methylphosphonate 5-triphosphate synthase subunit PhnH